MIGNGIGTPKLIGDGAAAFGYPLTNAWIAETSEADSTIIGALQTLELGLSDNGLTSKMVALYPFVGGNATKHKYNFMDTTTFELTFSGGWTHASTGALPNGTNAYADTGINPNDDLNIITHGSYYSRTNTQANAWAFGCNGPSYFYQMIIRSTGDLIFGRIQTNTTYQNATVTDSRGLFTMSRTAAEEVEGYKNGTSLSVTNNTSLSTFKADANLYLACRNSNGSPVEYDNKECAFASFGDGLSAGEVSTLYTLVQAFQTTLSRNV